MNTWYETLQFNENPFSIKPGFFDSKVFGNEKILNEVLKLVKKRKVCYVRGDYGFGKTTLLTRIMGEEKGNVIYYNCNSKERHINFDTLLHERSIFHRLLKLKPKNMVLLLDEVHEMGMHDCQALAEYYQKGYFKSIVMVSKSGESKFTLRLRRLIGKNKFAIDEIDEDEAVQLVRNRAGDRFFTDEEIKRIFAYSKKNPRLLLRNCEDICRRAMEQNNGRVDQKLIDGVFGVGLPSV